MSEDVVIAEDGIEDAGPVFVLEEFDDRKHLFTLFGVSFDANLKVGVGHDAHVVSLFVEEVDALHEFLDAWIVLELGRHGDEEFGRRRHGRQLVLVVMRGSTSLCWRRRNGRRFPVRCGR